jgi:hypothetical protein
MSPGDVYCAAKLVRVVGEMTTGPNSAPKPFCAGLLIHPETGRAIVTAPILNWARGQHQDKLRQSFARLGWKATVVRRS